MIYALRHETAYAYAQDVDLAAHYLHLLPLELPWQSVLAADITADPGPFCRREGRDCFGNRTLTLFVDRPHARFSATLTARVRVAAPPPPPDADTPPWEEIAALPPDGGAHHAAAEFLYPSPMVHPFPAATDYARADFPPGRPILVALWSLTTRMRREFAFRAGVTEIGTPLPDVLRRREGVCQDFAHLMIAALRGLGLPARYASGYLRTRPPPGQPKRRGADQSHAWVSCWLGPAHGWIDLDPTNGLIIADEHVVLAYGRDYADVSPLAGVILGGGAHTISVAVDLEAVSDEAALPPLPASRSVL